MSVEVVETMPTAVELNQLTSNKDRFAELNAILEKWFYKPDLQAVRIVLGAVKAHYLKIGDPAWLFLVAPPGSGKTTISLMGACGLPQVITLSDFSENTFLSGFYGHREAGVLEKLGPTYQEGHTYTTRGDAIFLAKDFTTVLSMRRDKRAMILSQLREIHDGMWKRNFGTGETKIWQGRVAVLAAVTPVLDRHYSIFSTLGERFLQIRWHRPDSEEAGEWAIEQQGQEEDIQKQAREAISSVVGVAATIAPTLPADMRARIAALAEIVALGRTHLFRDSYGTREIEYVPEPEANTRVSKGLAALTRGIAALNGHSEVKEQDLQDGFRVGLDCLPEQRRAVIIASFSGSDVSSLQMPPTVLRRVLEDLEALGLIEPATGSGFKVPVPTRSLTSRALELLQKAQLSLK
jgi:hypothetical protein